MPAYIEVHVVGNGRGYIEAGGVAAVLTPPGGDVHSVGTTDGPIRVVLRVGQTMDVVGESAGMILARCYGSRMSAKARKDAGGDDFFVDYLEPMERPE